MEEDDITRNSSGGIVVESLIMIRIVASLSIEESKSAEYAEALNREDTNPYRIAYLKGFATGIGQFIQMWGKWILYSMAATSWKRLRFILANGLLTSFLIYIIGIALLFWWGGWLMINYRDLFTYRDFLISMFSLLFSLSGIGVAAQGATNRDKAKVAAHRIFELTDRRSAIDPLSDEGKKEV